MNGLWGGMQWLEEQSCRGNYSIHVFEGEGELSVMASYGEIFPRNLKLLIFSEYGTFTAIN